MKKNLSCLDLAYGTSKPPIGKSTHIFKKTLLTVFLVTQMAAPQAAPALNAPVNAWPKVEAYGGVVVDQTITMIGSEFYQLFTTLWNEKPNVESYALLIRERPSARQGSQIWIESAQKRIFQSILPINRPRMRELAEQAVESTYESLIGADIQNMLFPEPDLGRDEL